MKKLIVQHFRTALLNSMGNCIVQSTQYFWASGLPPRFSPSTKPNCIHYLVHNKLAHALESVSTDLVKEEVLNRLPL